VTLVAIGIVRRATKVVLGSLSASDRLVARQTLWANGVAAVQVLGGILQVALTARILGPEGYGTLAVIIAASSIVFGLVGIPGGNTVTTFVTRSLAEGKQDEATSVLRFALATSFGLSVVGYGVVVGMALGALHLTGVSQANANALILYGTVGVVLSVQSEANAVLRLADRVSRSLGVALAGTLTRIVGLSVVWSGGGDLVQVVVVYVVGSLVDGLGLVAVAALSARRAGLIGMLRSLSIKIPRDLILFHAGMFGTTAVGTLNRYLDTLLLAQLTTVSNVGMYRAGRQVMDSVRQPFNALATAIRPEYSKRWFSRDGLALRRMAARFTVLSALSAVTAFGLVAIFREEIVRIVLGDDFAGLGSVILILCLGSFLACACAPLGALPVAAGRAKAAFVPMIAGLIASIAAIVLLVPSHGAEGAAWARNIHYFVAVPISLLFVMSVLRDSRKYQSSLS